MPTRIIGIVKGGGAAVRRRGAAGRRCGGAAARPCGLVAARPRGCAAAPPLGRAITRPGVRAPAPLPGATGHARGETPRPHCLCLPQANWPACLKGRRADRPHSERTLLASPAHTTPGPPLPRRCIPSQATGRSRGETPRPHCLCLPRSNYPPCLEGRRTERPRKERALLASLRPYPELPNRGEALCVAPVWTQIEKNHAKPRTPPTWDRGFAW